MTAEARDRVRTLTLGQLVLMLAVAFLLFASVVSYAVSQQIRGKAVTDLAREDARQVAELAFFGLYSAMRKGWSRDEIEQIVGDLNALLPGMRVRVYRGEPVIRQFGDVAPERRAAVQDRPLLRALADGEEYLEVGADAIRFLFPVRVREECLRCHGMARVGEVNGVIDVAYQVGDLKVSLAFVLNVISVTFLAMLAVLVAVLYGFQRGLVARPIGRLVAVISDIISSMDFRRRVEPGSHIAEIADLKRHFNSLLDSLGQYHAQLEQVSTRDALTELYNRSKFQGLVEIECARHAEGEESFCLLVLDLDHFKQVNDVHGPAVGDVVLRQIADFLRGWAGEQGVPARLSGDSFGLLLPHTTAEQGLRYALTVSEYLTSATLGFEEDPVRVTASVGVVVYPRDGKSCDQLYAAIDQAVIKAKRQGRNRVVALEASDRASSAKHLGRGDYVICAVQEGRLVAELEPIIELSSGRVYGYEALARIREGGELVKAHKFIAAAEQFGYAEAVDLRVIEQTLAARAGPTDGRLFFNLSAKSLASRHTMERIEGMICGAKVDPGRVVFEITEREALPNLARLSSLMRRFRRKGFAFALDDFGSGFSTFLYLKHLAVDYVKIEGSFVRDILNDEQDRMLVSNMARLVRDFGIPAIAEYVEHAQTEELLRELGVQYSQGYLYRGGARAMERGAAG